MAKTDKDGNWIDRHGRFVPPDKVKLIDRIQDEAVEEMVRIALKLEMQMLEAKVAIVARFDKALADIGQAGKLTREKWKGNVSLRSYSGDLVAERSISDRIVLDARLKMVKTLLDEFLSEHLEGANSDIAILVMQKFRVNKQGNISVKDILSLLQIDIREPKWVKAMQLLKDSIQTISSVTYYRFFMRVTVGTGETMRPIALDFSSIKEAAA
jgi:hypothetical protein